MYAYNDELRARIAGMFQPVRCNRCHSGVYDLGKSNPDAGRVNEFGVISW